MGRRKLSEDEKLEVVGISLPPVIVKRLEKLSEDWGLPKKASIAGRELLLLGLAQVEGLTNQGAVLPFLNLLEAYRQENPPGTKDKPTLKPFAPPADFSQSRQAIPQPDFHRRHLGRRPA